MDENAQEALSTASVAAQCPVDHSFWSQQKTASISDASAATDEPARPAIECDADGNWHVRSFQEARDVLRSDATKQAGFNAEQFEQLSRFLKPAMLYQEGQTHQQQRKQTARFFTPKAVDSNYRQLMESFADGLIADLQRDKKGDLSDISFKLAVAVAAQIIGLTNSRSGVHKRLNDFFSYVPPTGLPVWHPQKMYALGYALYTQLNFYVNDVRPAIRARKRQPQDDLISSMLTQKARNRDIHIECLTYAAAGMVTTREFINLAAWHFLEQPTLRARYLAAPEEERYSMLEEILRLEPVVGHLYRRATKDFSIESNGTAVTIPQGDLIHLHTYAINADPQVVTEQPRAICPNRELRAERAPASLMSFGDGDHRCAGLYVAIQESDIFLHRLLALDNLSFEQPNLTWNGVTTGYEVRKFMLTLA